MEKDCSYSLSPHAYVACGEYTVATVVYCDNDYVACGERLYLLVYCDVIM